MSVKIRMGSHRSLYLFIERKKRTDEKFFLGLSICSYWAITH